MPRHALTGEAVRMVAPHVVAPVADWFHPAASSNAGGANFHISHVCRVPVTGTLRDVMIYVQTSSGNVSASIYSVGVGGADRTRLWASGSVPCGPQGWQIVGDPQLAVTEGQLITLGMGADNATATFMRFDGLLSGAQSNLPAAYVPEGTVRMATAHTSGAGFPDPGATWTAPSATTLVLGVVARVVPS